MRTAVIGWTLMLWSAGMQFAFGQSAGFDAHRAADAPARQAAVYATRQTSFAIPFTVDRRIAQPVEVHLYVSTDRGANWQLASRQAPTTRQFVFRAQGDGEYWFASRTLDANGQARPQGALDPELRIVVDTVQPQIEFTARTGEAGDITTTWHGFDQNLDANSLRIEYQDGIGQPWKPVAVKTPRGGGPRSTFEGQMTWWPQSSSPTVNIRAELRDRAGNLVVVNRRLLLPSVASRSTASPAGNHNVPNDPFARLGSHSEGAVPWPSDNKRATDTGVPGPADADNAARLASSRPDPDKTTSHQPLPPFRQAGKVPDLDHFPGDVAQQPKDEPLPPTARKTLPELPPSFSDVNGEVGATMAEPVSTELASAYGESALPAGERPQMTNALQFRLDYDVDAVGPAGVAEVQLWATDSGGQSWTLWGTDDDRQSPFEVEVEQEGLYGFRVVIVGQNGLSGRPPQAGDPADLWVGVDTTEPTARITSAEYGTGHQIGQLIVGWQATDTQLETRPISLYFSESPDGPWTVIASGLPNEGEFAWPADPHLPSDIYLRLEVRDEAGNVGVHDLSEPIRVDGLVPKARIRGIMPLPNVDRAAFRRARQRQ